MRSFTKRFYPPRWNVLLVLLLTSLLTGAAEEVLVEAGKFTEVYDPTASGKESWCINDHTFVRGPDRQWHVFGITHPLPLDFFKDPGNQLLHITSKELTANPWQKQPFAVVADWEKYGEKFFWAPHVIRHKGLYYMFVCVGNKDGHLYKIHLLTSKDLRHWDRSPANPLLIDGFDGRDPFVLRDGKQWIMYYTATCLPEGGHHTVVSVTSKDLKHWASRRVVFTHPKQGTFGGPTESPFVVRRGKSYYLFACDGGTINVFLSDNPFHWDVKKQVRTIFAHASEVVRDLDGKWFISHAGWFKGGLALAPLIWKDGLDKADSSL